VLSNLNRLIYPFFEKAATVATQKSTTQRAHARFGRDQKERDQRHNVRAFIIVISLLFISESEY